MFAFRYKGQKTFKKIGNGKYYKKNWFKEQMADGTYIRPLSFFVEHRQTLLDSDIEKEGIKEVMKVKYVGKGCHSSAVNIGGKKFKYDVWQEVPIDFDSRDNHGNDLFLTLGFKFAMSGTIRDSLEPIDMHDVIEKILIIRQYGGLGDILMQSQILPEIRKRHPHSEITYAIPKEYLSLFENCLYINRAIDVSEINTNLHKFISSGEYQFIGDISQTCIRGEMNDMRETGRFVKSRQRIWAESIGLYECRFENTAISITDEERHEALKELGYSNKPFICISPSSNEGSRSYPINLTKKLISLLKDNFQVVVIDNKGFAFDDCINFNSIPLRKIGAILSNCDYTIGVDSGILHFAGILGKQVIGLFGVTSWHPRLKHYNGIGIQGACSKQKEPCWYSEHSDCKSNDGIANCMYIEPEDILNKVLASREYIINSNPKVGIVIPIFNRPEYLSKTLNSIKESDLPDNTTILLINDASTDANIQPLINSFSVESINIIKISSDTNKGVAHTIMSGFDMLYSQGCDVLCNIDSDMVMSKDWLQWCLTTLKENNKHIVSAYDCKLHGDVAKDKGFKIKESIGGASLCFARDSYKDLIREHLDEGNNWDWCLSYVLPKRDRKIIVSHPSRMQHIGDFSTLNHQQISKAQESYV